MDQRTGPVTPPLPDVLAFREPQMDQVGRHDTVGAPRPIPDPAARWLPTADRVSPHRPLGGHEHAHLGRQPGGGAPITIGEAAAAAGVVAAELLTWGNRNSTSRTEELRGRVADLSAALDLFPAVGQQEVLHILPGDAVHTRPDTVHISVTVYAVSTSEITTSRVTPRVAAVEDIADPADPSQVDDTSSSSAPRSATAASSGRTTTGWLTIDFTVRRAPSGQLLADPFASAHRRRPDVV